MTPNDRLELVLSLARVVHVNGQSTDETMAAAERLGKALDLHAWIIPRWGELQLQAGGGDATLISVAAADPTGVEMDRVVSAMRAADDVAAGRLTPSDFRAAMRVISETPPAPTWLFALAAAAGAAALAVLSGAQPVAPVALLLAGPRRAAALPRLLRRAT